MDRGVHGSPGTPGKVYDVQIEPGFATRSNQGLDITLEAAHTHPWGIAADYDNRLMVFAG